MPNVNALKGLIIDKITREKLNNTVKNKAYEAILYLNLKNNENPNIVIQKIVFKMAEINGNLARNIATSNDIYRLASVKPLPVNVKKSIKKSSPKSSGREARRATVRSASMALRRTTGLPTNLLDKIMKPLIFRSVAQRKRR
jgi:hypothetical protein